MAGVVGLFVVSFDQLDLLELRAGADEGDEVRVRSRHATMTAIRDGHRHAVHLMTPADVFPYASNTSRSMEIDHTTPYCEGGPSIGEYGHMTGNHHRFKTHDNWDVRQRWPGIYVWRDPYGTL